MVAELTCTFGVLGMLPEYCARAARLACVAAGRRRSLDRMQSRTDVQYLHFEVQSLSWHAI
jgi:hypothetical protein